MKHLPNRCDLISDLNLAKLEQEQMLAGRELNKHGATLEKALSPNVTHLVLGAINLTLVDCLVCRIGICMAIACFK